jgi:hypothetical protein
VNIQAIHKAVVKKLFVHLPQADQVEVDLPAEETFPRSPLFIVMNQSPRRKSVPRQKLIFA